MSCSHATLLLYCDNYGACWHTVLYNGRYSMREFWYGCVLLSDCRATLWVLLILEQLLVGWKWNVDMLSFILDLSGAAWLAIGNWSTVSTRADQYWNNIMYNFEVRALMKPMKVGWWIWKGRWLNVSIDPEILFFQWLWAYRRWPGCRCCWCVLQMQNAYCQYACI